MADISRTNVQRLRDAEVNRISAKIETYSVTKVKICLEKHKDYEEIFFLPPDVGVAVLICLRSLVSCQSFDSSTQIPSIFYEIDYCTLKYKHFL